MACDATDCDQQLHAFVGILCDACENFQDYCVEGIELNIAQINQYVDRSLMLVTAWSPVIGDDTASSPTTPTAADVFCGGPRRTVARSAVEDVE